MMNKLLQFFKPILPKDYMSGFDFRPNIKAVRMEVYKKITVLYLTKPTPGGEQLVYHLWKGKDFYSGEADTLSNLIESAHYDIDTKFKFK